MSETKIQCGAAISINEDTSAAASEVCVSAMQSIGNGDVDLAVVFISPHHADRLSLVAKELQQATAARVVLGCTGESIAGPATEVEGEPAIALFLARLPSVELTPMHLQFQQTPDGGTFSGWPDSLQDDWPEDSGLLLLGDPFSFPTEALLERVNDDHPGVAVFGGMASGAATPGETRLLLGDQVLSEGAVAVLFDGPVRIRNIVSQGCRPIGTHFVITKAEQNVIQELGGLPAMQQLNELFQSLPNRDQLLVQQGLHVGRVMSEYQGEFQQGDFLIKNVIGVDPGTGGIAIADYVRVGQTVQFHVRDEQSADAEFTQLLSQAQEIASLPAAGALLFSCNGRGTRMFSTPHHDAAKVNEIFGDVPLAGFFAQGEIGPVGGRNFMHGFTASLALFEEAQDD